MDRPPPGEMLVLGLTGGFGAGKTTVARLLAARGARVLDADRIVRELYAGGELPARIARSFGTEVLAADGSIERGRLAEIVFASDAARRELEQMVHPAVRVVIEETLDRWREEGFRGIVVVEAALLVETEHAYPLDALVVVTAAEGTRLRRLAARGVSPEQARRRMAAQASDEQRRARADHVVRNEGTLADLEREVEGLLADLGRDRADHSR
jgi:dephospho-CoA kinase